MNFMQMGWILLVLLEVLRGNANKSRSESGKEHQYPLIDHINTFGESRYMKVSTFIYNDRSHFDIKVRLMRELGSNYLLLNIRLRVKPEGAKKFVRVFDWKRGDFCGFLTEYNDNALMRSMLRKSIQLSDMLVCPIRVGNYSIMNVAVDSIYPTSLQNGIYKFFAEVVKGNGEIAKVFALQVTTVINAPQE